MRIYHARDAELFLGRILIRAEEEIRCLAAPIGIHAPVSLVGHSGGEIDQEGILRVEDGRGFGVDLLVGSQDRDVDEELLLSAGAVVVEHVRTV